MPEEKDLLIPKLWSNTVLKRFQKGLNLNRLLEEGTTHIYSGNHPDKIEEEIIPEDKNEGIYF